MKQQTKYRKSFLFIDLPVFHGTEWKYIRITGL